MGFRVGRCALGLLALLTGIAQADIRVVDDAGQEIHLNAPVRRIVSLSPHITELLFEAGAGQYLVGVAEFSNFPESARRIARVGDARGIDVEGVVRKRPDLVVAWGSGNARQTLSAIRRFGIAVFESEPRRLLDIAQTIERLGALAGTRPAAGRQARAFRERLEAIAARYAGEPTLRVFYQIWDRPLMTIGSQHMIADALAICGARSVFDGLDLLTPSPSREAVVLADPDAILVASRDPAALEPWLQWKRLRAVAGEGILVVDPERMHRHTSRALDSVEAMCASLRKLRQR